MKIAHILITSDLSGEAVRPCEPVSHLARALGARITLLHVAENLPIAGLAAPGESLILPTDIPERTHAAREHLEKQRALFPGIDVRIEVLSGLDATYEILEFARKNAVDLIAMSTHGRTGFRRLVLGSVAEAVLRRSTVPVVLFPRAEDQEPQVEKNV